MLESFRGLNKGPYEGWKLEHMPAEFREEYLKVRNRASGQADRVDPKTDATPPETS